MRAGLGVDELGIDRDSILIALHRTFQQVSDAELPTDLFGVSALALEGGVAGDHETVVDARQLGREVIGDPIGEVILRRTAREIRERQNHDRKMLGLGFGRYPGVRFDGAGRFATRKYYPPPAEAKAMSAVKAAASSASAARFLDASTARQY